MVRKLPMAGTGGGGRLEEVVAVQWMQCDEKEVLGLNEWVFGLVYEDPLEAPPRSEHVLSFAELRCRNAGRNPDKALMAVVGELPRCDVAVAPVCLDRETSCLSKASYSALKRAGLQARYYAAYDERKIL